MQNNSGTGGVEFLPSIREALSAFTAGRMLTCYAHNLKPAAVCLVGGEPKS